MHKHLYSNDICKEKNLKWGGTHRCLPLHKGGRKSAFLSFTNVDSMLLAQTFCLDVVSKPMA
jgi:hypothetical protein